MYYLIPVVFTVSLLGAGWIKLLFAEERKYEKEMIPKYQGKTKLYCKRLATVLNNF